VRASLDVGLEVAGVEGEVHLPDPRGIRVLLELAIDAGQIEQRVSVTRPQPRDLFVLGGGLADDGLRLGTDRLDLVELGEDEVRVGVLAVEPDGLDGLLGGLVEPPHLPVEARRLDPDGGGRGVELPGATELRERSVGVTGQAGLQPEAVVEVRLRAVRGSGDRGRGRCGRRGGQDGEDKNEQCRHD
jgi:hypothetical protein